MSDSNPTPSATPPNRSRKPPASQRQRPGVLRPLLSVPPAASPVVDVSSAELMEVGTIVGAQGLQGEVRVYPSSDFPERFTKAGTRWLRLPGKPEPQPYQLTRGRYLAGKGLYVVQFAEVRDRTAAENLRDAKLLVPASDRPRLGEDEFYIQDLIGLEVFDQATQTRIGVVQQVIPAGNDLLEVERPDASPVLIPFVKAIVPVVDITQRRIEVTPPDGLIE